MTVAEESQYKDAEGPGLMPLKPEVPLPFGIMTVKEEPQSTYDRQNTDQDLNDANLGMEMEDPGLLPLKPEVPLPFGIMTVAEEP